MLPLFVVVSKVFTNSFRAKVFIRFRTGGAVESEVYSLCHYFLSPLFLNFLGPSLLGIPSEDPKLNVLISPGPELCFKHKTRNLTLAINSHYRLPFIFVMSVLSF